MLKNINSLNYDDFYASVSPYLKVKEQRIIGYNYLARYYIEKEVADSSIYYGNKIYDLSVQKEDPYSYKMLSKSYNILAIAYGFKGLNKIRGSYHLKGIELYDKGLVDTINSIDHIRGLADYYTDEGVHDKAIPLYEKSIDLNKNSNTIYLAYNNLGLIYTKLKKYDVALEYLNKVKEAPDGLKVKGFNLVNLSACYFEMGDLNKAISFGLQAKEQFGKKNEDAKFMLVLDNIIGKSYHKQKQYDKAISIFENTINKAEKNGFIDVQIEISKNISNSLSENDNYEKALKYIANGFKLKDSLIQIQKVKESNQLEQEFQISKKEKEVELLKKERQTSRDLLNIILISFFLISLSVIILFVINNQKRAIKSKLDKKEKEVNIDKINAIIKDHELKLVKSNKKKNKEL